MNCRHRHTGFFNTRRLIGLAILLSVCASLLPLPVPQFVTPEKDRSQPFPCQNRPCGCASAEQCWKQCCCFTNAEKLVWARENGVEVPQYVVEAAQKEAETAVAESSPATAKKPHSCCSTFGKTRKADSCCETPKRSTADRDAAGPRKAADFAGDTNYVIGIQLMKCRGQGSFWNMLPWAIVPLPQIEDLHNVPEVQKPPQSTFADSAPAAPPEPPPRLA